MPWYLSLDPSEEWGLSDICKKLLTHEKQGVQGTAQINKKKKSDQNKTLALTVQFNKNHMKLTQNNIKPIRQNTFEIHKA